MNFKEATDRVNEIFVEHLRLCHELQDIICINHFGYDEKAEDLFIEISPVYDLNKWQNSIYNCAKETQFIHYTSLKSLLSIISERKIRLYSLDNANDPNEIRYASEFIKHCDGSINNMSKSVFAFSMCEYNDDEKLDIWRFYGNEGYGVGIIFSIDRSNIELWRNFALSQIHYGENKIKHFIVLDNLIEKFKTELKKLFKGEVVVNVFISRLLAQHKMHYYENEKEVRISYSTSLRGDLLPVNTINYRNNSFPIFYPDFNRFNRRVNYLELPIWGNKEYREIMPFLPVLKIESIKLGYRYNDSDVLEVKGVINELAERFLGYSIESVELTSLKNQFR